MLCVPIVGPELSNIKKQLLSAAQNADLFELRLDLFRSFDKENLRKLKEECDRPCIFTLRKRSQGGGYSKDESSRQTEIEALAMLSPEYFDIEYETCPDFINKMIKKFPKIKWILSYHNFSETPLYLEETFAKLQQFQAAYYKIACYANSTCDSLRMVLFAKTRPCVLGICMGEKGSITRILSPIIENAWTFSPICDRDKTAEGQLTLDELKDVYAIKRFTKASSVYGLIGNPVSKSLSQFSHNKVMREYGLDSVYIKMQLEQEDIKDFFSLFKQCGFKGLSVTMPYKEDIFPYLDEVAPDAKAIGAINTVHFQNGRLLGYNTDGKGALDAIESRLKVANKKIIILGAGGAARAIIYEAKKRGGNILILNRTFEKAQLLARQLDVEAENFETFSPKVDYDILINTTPLHDPIPEHLIRPKSLIMTINTIPKMTPLIQYAKEKKCIVVYGYEMFVNQAAEQFNIWFHNQLNLQKVKNILKKEILNRLSLAP